MCHGVKEPASPDVRVLHKIRRRVYRQPRYAVLLHQFGEIFFEEAGCKRSHLRVDIGSVSTPLIAVDPFWIVEFRRVIFPDFKQERPMRLRDKECDVAVSAFEQIGWGVVLVLAANVSVGPDEFNTEAVAINGPLGILTGGLVALVFWLIRRPDRDAHA